MAELAKATTTDDLVKDYDNGMNLYALVDKYHVDYNTVLAIVNKAFPQDVDGEDLQVQKLVEGESPKAK